jgi:hypothetical protein
LKTTFLIFLIFVFASNIIAQSKPSIYINEFLASNVSVDADIVDFDDYSDWIELYNDEDTDIDLGGYTLTDDPDNPFRWQIPQGTIITAKGFLRFWADGYDDIPGHTYTRSYTDQNNNPIYFTTEYYHLNFNLSRAGEYIGLYNPEGYLIDSVYFDLQYRDISYGRQPDGTDTWYFFGEPTPEASNVTTGTSLIVYAEKPELSLEGGFYSGSQIVAITAISDSMEIRYTIDGSTPGTSSTLYENPIEISQNTVLRVRVFESGKLPSEIITESYFINETIELPVISLSVNPYYMWSNKKGVYENIYKGIELPAHIEFFNSDGLSAYNFNAGIRLTGQLSVFYDQKSFTIEMDDRFGMDVLNEVVFPERPLDNYSALYLRNAGIPDNQSTFFRDALQHTLVLNKIDIDCQAYLPYAVYINGAYWGIYNLREKIDADYVAGMNNINPDDVDLLEYENSPNPTVMEGNADNYKAFYTYIETHDLSILENYEFVTSWMDIDEYINYQICEIYFNNVIWLTQNVRMWRERKEDRKWRWIMHDLDIGFGLANPTMGYMNNMLTFATSTGATPGSPPAWSTMIFRKLLENNTFKNQFIQRFATYMNTIFSSSTVLSVIDSLKNNIGAEMPRHISRWRNAEYGTPILNYSEWLSNIEVMKNFARYRPYHQRQHLIDYFDLDGTTNVNLSIQNAGSGFIKINKVFKSGSEHSGIYFKNIPMTLEAIPKVGYKFIKWQGAGDSTVNPLTFFPETDTLNILAIFESESINLLPSHILNDTTLQKINSPFYASGHVWVDSNKTLSVEAGVEILMPHNKSIIVNGRILIQGTGADPVVIKPNSASDSWGALCILNATDQSDLNHLYIVEASKGIDFTQDRAAISCYNSKVLMNAIYVEDVQAPIFAQYGHIEIKNSKLYSNYAGDLINIKYADSARVENCDLQGNDSFDSDAIDYDHLSDGIIRGNRIYNFYGFNSDAIDLGENSQDILIENNIIYNINDKGISIGNGSTGILKRNVIVNCGQGVGIKDFDSHGYVEHCTFYGNKYGIACFVKNIGEGGGNADVVNSILASSSICVYLVDTQSSLNISYSMSDRFELPGLYNSTADPGFINNLLLSADSYAINKGNPTFPPDPDGSLPDLGAYPFDPLNPYNLVINEIHYNPVEGESFEFVEILNAGSSTIHLNNYKLTGSIQFTFPDESIESNEIIVIAKTEFEYLFADIREFQWDTGTLPDGEGELILLNDKGDTLDFVNYNSRYFWPREPDGMGPSLELHHPSMENMASNSWRSSYVIGGSRGLSNNAVKIEGLYINEFLASNSSIITDENGDYDDWIEIYNSTNNPINIGGLYITDNPDIPYKYQIPNYDLQKTTIPAKGYLLCWADNEIEQGITHVNFKLDMDGEHVAIVQRIENEAVFLDSLTFLTQETDISYGRYPDGSNIWYSFKSPTPLDSNKISTNLDGNPVKPEIYSLSQNYPNPFNPITTILYTVGAQNFVPLQHIDLSIYNILGQKVMTLINKKQPAGSYKIEWDASGFSSGVYFYRMKADNRFVKTKKLLLLK